MTAGERPTTAEPEERSLSAEEAERIAASIRPSWEAFDELPFARGEARGSAPGPDAGATAAAQPTVPGAPLAVAPEASREPASGSSPAAAATLAAAAAAPPAAAPPAAAATPAAGVREAPPAGASAVSDTVIDGVPTIAVGDDPKDAPAPEAAPRDAGGADRSGERSPLPVAQPRETGSAGAASATEAGAGERGAPPAPAGKTRLGVGEPDPVDDAPTAAPAAVASPPAAVPDAVGDARTAAPDAVAGAQAIEPQAPPASAPSSPPADGPRSTRTRSRAAHPTARSADTVAASAVRTEDHDPIEIPVSAPNKTALRIGIAVVGAAFLFFVGRAVLAPGRDDAGADRRPTSASPAATSPAEAPTAAPAATPAATSQATAGASPAAAEGAATPPAPSASAPASAPVPAATPATSAAAPSAAGAAPAAAPPAPKATTPAKKPAPAAPTQRAPGPAGGNKGGGIIRDAPF